MNQQVQVFHAESSILMVQDRKGKMHHVTPEGAMFRGGAFIAALKDCALESALAKAIGGRYRAASDILCAAFPSIGKAADKLIGTPWANKATFTTLVTAVLRAEAPAKGYSDKQTKARLLARAWERATTPVDESIARELERIDAEIAESDADETEAAPL